MIENQILMIISWVLIGINILYAIIDTCMYVVKRNRYGHYGTNRELYEQECNNIKTGAIHHLAWAILILLILR
jgi:hypothetical protein